MEKSGITEVVVNNRILQRFNGQIKKLMEAAKAANKKGGSSLKRLINAWTNGPKKSYRFSVYYNEVSSIQLENENMELSAKKRKLEEDLVEEKAKRMRLQEKLNEALSKAEKKDKIYKKKFKRLARKIIKLRRQKGGRGPQKAKSFADYTPQHQSRIRKQLVEDCQATLSFVGLYNFIATKVEVFNEDTQTYETFHLLDEESELQLTDEQEQVTDQDIDNINLLLYIKERFNISDLAWHELSVKLKEMPNLFSLKKRTEALNGKWNIAETPGEHEGVQIKFADSLKAQVERLQKEGFNDTTIKVKLSGDGTCIGKRLNVVNFTYTILNEGNIAMTESGNYVLAIIKTKENYDSIRVSLGDLKDEMENLKEITVNDKNYKIEYFLGGDWKFLVTVCGLGPANQEHACIWCKCPREDRWDTNKQWSMIDAEKGARSLEEIMQYSRRKQFNCKNPPLFPFISLDHVIIDTLHLFLRISDNLIELLIRELRRQDSIEKKSTFAHGFPRDKFKHMAAYEKLLRDLGISFEWRVGPETKKLEYRDLNGPEKITLFQHINIPTLLPSFKEAQSIQELWVDFMNIIGDLKLDYNDKKEVDALQMKIKDWLKKFTNSGIYQAKDVTPYMHALFCHVPEFLSMYCNLNFFNQQGMEKYNDLASKDYFRSTNHRGVECLRQMFLKKNRLQFLQGVGCERIKLSYKCSNCNNNGHTIKTCTAKCSSCDHNVCCGHLQKVHGKWVKKCLQN